MIKKSDHLQLKFYCILKKAISSLINLRAFFFITIVFALSATAMAQTIVDYNLPQNWMCHPVLKSTDIARQQNLTLVVKNPDNSTKDSINYTRDNLVDIFYIYPTIDMSRKSGNTAIDSIDINTAEFVYREQAGIYARFGRVFVPYYRQAKIGVFITTNPLNNTEQLTNAECLKLAYNDIDSAFCHYMKYYNKGRKIILIGHSQGADMERFLLRNRFDNDTVLQSQLVVAISGGEPNYTSTSGSRTGGSLQNIKTCPPQGSPQECGCVMNWRTWNRDYAVGYLNKTSFFYNHYFADTGLIYQIYDTVYHSHIESSYDFGYDTNTTKVMPRFITLDSTMTNYLAFDSLFTARVTSVDTIPGSAYLWIDSNYIPNDQRKTGKFPGINKLLQGTIPIPNTVANYHIWDMQFVQWDLLNLIPDLIAMTHPITSVTEIKKPEHIVTIYPNPSNGNVHVKTDNQKIKSIRIYNLKGDFVEEFFTNDFSVLNLTPGIYLINIQTDKSTFIKKLVKQ